MAIFILVLKAGSTETILFPLNLEDKLIRI